jgi:hypothetical protein
MPHYTAAGLLMNIVVEFLSRKLCSQFYICVEEIIHTVNRVIKSIGKLV